ncbi:glycine cleavage system protein R [Paraferrimonas sp. SM1919]|uniref:glycine cleavage system protein R n=1 Tax=Paraferrimonas sp. SM1919 TaxID=2662263 RepID=UPI0013D29FC3|nr:ACT domain-containing protein [Paraferrimonas sp. SM1919]
MPRYLINLQAPDEQGLVEKISNIIKDNHGNWLESELSHQYHIFAAIIVLDAGADNIATITEKLQQIDKLSLLVSPIDNQHKATELTTFTTVGYDRIGFVQAISKIISGQGLNIEKMTSYRSSASHSGIALFHAEITVDSSNRDTIEQLKDALYELGDDIQID